MKTRSWPESGTDKELDKRKENLRMCLRSLIRPPKTLEKGLVKGREGKEKTFLPLQNTLPRWTECPECPQNGSKELC